MAEHGEFRPKAVAGALKKQGLWGGGNLQIGILVEEAAKLGDSLVDRAYAAVSAIGASVGTCLICLVINDQARQSPHASILKVLNKGFQPAGVFGGYNRAGAAFNARQKAGLVLEIIFAENVYSGERLLDPPQSLLIQGIVIGRQNDEGTVPFVGAHCAGNGQDTRLSALDQAINETVGFFLATGKRIDPFAHHFFGGFVYFRHFLVVADLLLQQAQDLIAMLHVNRAPILRAFSASSTERPFWPGFHRGR